MTPAEKLYRRLLRLYPVEHRRMYGAPMLQHARDLERATRPLGRWPLYQLYLRLCGDGLRNAAVEQLEALMTNNRFTPASWLTVLLALAPGLLLLVSSAYILQPGTQWVHIVARLAYLAVLLVGLVFWALRRQFPAWALLPAGFLAWFAVYLAGTFVAQQWNTFGLLQPFSNAIESGIFLLQALVTIVLFAVLLRGRRVPWLAWLAVAAIVVAYFFSAQDYLKNWPYLSPATQVVQFLTVAGFVPVEGFMLTGLGLLAVRRHGMRALLVFVGGFVYMLMDSDYYSGPNFNQWPGFPAFAASLVFLFLVILPLGVLRARSRLQLALSVFIPFGIFHFAREAVPNLVLHGQLTASWPALIPLFFLALAWALYDQAVKHSVTSLLGFTPEK